MRATLNQDMSRNCVKKDKIADGSPTRLCVSYSFNAADYCGKGTGYFRSSGEQKWKSNWSEQKLDEVIAPISTSSDYLDLACAGAKKMSFHGPLGKAST